MSRQLFQIVVTVKLLTGKAVETKRLLVPVCNNYELETFLDDLSLALEGEILDTSVQCLVSGIN